MVYQQVQIKVISRSFWNYALQRKKGKIESVYIWERESVCVYEREGARVFVCVQISVASMDNKKGELSFYLVVIYYIFNW